MFTDLTDIEIQPEKTDAEHIPDIEIPQKLCEQLEGMFREEEGNRYVKVFQNTTVVQSDRNYVFFANQWYYLAVICKSYAEALYPYCTFFDNNIRNNQELLKCIAAGRTSDAQYVGLFENQTECDKMTKFVISDNEYRPGKNLINGDKVRSCKDVFGSCVLKKLPVPDASSAYLGNLIYYLAKRPQLFSKLESIVMDQFENKEGIKRLPATVKECAKAIVDYVYDLDHFKHILPLFSKNDKSISINTDGIGARNYPLNYVFILSDSRTFIPDESSKTRVFEDSRYEINFGEVTCICKLTSEWCDPDNVKPTDRNYLRALIAVVNEYYSDFLKITKERGRYYLHIERREFRIENLPEKLKSDFARRYITSLLAKPFVILTGNSGTGKTRIAKQFAEYFERMPRDRKNWMIVPVGADWTDNTKILGFYNPLADNGKGAYIKTGILELIEQANLNKEIPYFLILDEMNLSHVERYFSDFLSHMEIPGSVFEIDGYEEVQPFPDNLFVVGTVNIDETTYMFSPKVLDRANVVEFKPDEESIVDLLINPVSTEEIQAAYDMSDEAFLRVAREIRSGKCGLKKEDLEKASDILRDIYEALEKCGFEFAYRTMKEVRQYISAAAEIDDNYDGDKLLRSVDEQILQKIMPKIHGNRKEIGGLLDELQEICTNNSLHLSRKKIEQMRGKLVTTQYASFI